MADLTPNPTTFIDQHIPSKMADLTPSPISLVSTISDLTPNPISLVSKMADLTPNPIPLVSKISDLTPNPISLVSEMADLTPNPISLVSKMADLTPNPTAFIEGFTTILPNTNSITQPFASLVSQIQSFAPTGQVFGLLALFSPGRIRRLLLIGITVTASILGFIAFLPLIIITSPIWIPLLLILTGILSFGGFIFGTGASLSWIYRYFKGMHPAGSDQVDYARSRIYDTAAHVKDYADEYLHNKLKDAAPLA